MGPIFLLVDKYHDVLSFEQSWDIHNTPRTVKVDVHNWPSQLCKLALTFPLPLEVVEQCPKEMHINFTCHKNFTDLSYGSHEACPMTRGIRGVRI